MDYQRVAAAICGRTAELLRSTVVVTDDRDLIIAGSDPRAIGLPSRLAGDILQSAYLHVPLRLDSRACEVIVARPRDSEAPSPRLARVVVDLVISQMIVVNRLPNQHALKNKFIHDVLHGLVVDEVAILREARVLELDLAPPRAVILIDAADYLLPSDGVSLERRIELLIGSIVSFFRLPSDTICAHMGNGEVAVLKASNTRNLAVWASHDREPEGLSSSWANLEALKRASSALLVRLRGDTGAAINIGVGRHHPGLHGLARSYQDARAALSLGRSFHGQNQVHCLDQLGIAAFVGLADERTKLELALHLLSPLDHEPELLHTLDIFFKNDCYPSPTAQELAVHRNTLAYRLNKIASLTGLDPRRFDDAVQVRLALVLRSLHDSHAAVA